MEVMLPCLQNAYTGLPLTACKQLRRPNPHPKTLELCTEKLERAKGFEPSTPTLARLCSTLSYARSCVSGYGCDAPTAGVKRALSGRAKPTQQQNAGGGPPRWLGAQFSRLAGTCALECPCRTRLQSHMVHSHLHCSRPETFIGKPWPQSRRTESGRSLPQGRSRAFDDQTGRARFLGRMVRLRARR